MAGISMENIVRPFQSVDVSPRNRSLGQPGGAPQGPVTLSWGGNGGKTFTYTFSFSSSFSDAISGGSKYKEIRRVAETKRIENPDDPSQFVEFKRAKEITVKQADDAFDLASFLRKFGLSVPKNTAFPGKVITTKYEWPKDG